MIDKSAHLTVERFDPLTPPCYTNVLCAASVVAVRAIVGTVGYELGRGRARNSILSLQTGSLNEIRSAVPSAPRGTKEGEMVCRKRPERKNRDWKRVTSTEGL